MPYRSTPISDGDSFQAVHDPDRTKVSASGSRRAAASISANVRSAVVSVRTSGVFVTVIPRRLATGRSMLSTPTATLEMTSSCGFASSTDFSSRSVNWQTTP